MVETGEGKMEKLQLFRDVAHCGPPSSKYAHYEKEDIYKEVPAPDWQALDDEVWDPSKQKSDLDESAFTTMKLGGGKSTFRFGDAAAVSGFGKRLQKKAKKNKKNIVRKKLDGNAVTGIMTVVTLFALFMDDIRRAAMPKEADIPIAWISLLAMVLFATELVLRVYSQKGYLWSFFFYLDLVATLSCITDITLLFNNGASSGGGGAEIARAGRAARTGTRVGRLVRLVRIIRVVKLVALVGKKASQHDDDEEAQKKKLEEARPSQLGKKLNAIIGQTVILGVLVLMLGMNLLQADSWIGQNMAREAGLDMLVLSKTDLEAAKANVEADVPAAQAMFDSVRDAYLNRHKETLLYLVVKGDRLYPDTLPDGCPDDLALCPDSIGSLRDYEQEIYWALSPPDSSEETEAEAWFTTKAEAEWSAVSGTITTIYITFMLGIGGFFLTRDSDKLVISPIESMVTHVQDLAKNPALVLDDVAQVKYETDQLKAALKKISRLLQIGFGEAGNRLVAENLQKGGAMNPMVPGTRIWGAFGFSIIDDCDELLEMLGEDILRFVNTISDIIHKAVVDNCGQPNRNLGEAFLCVWQTPPQPLDDQSAWETKICDGALTAFRRSVRDIAKSAALAEFEEVPQIREFFQGSYKTRLGFGLNWGWAIEGAVGTAIKIDCSYLSPNVNLAARLESATKMYGCNILMSEYFVDKLSDRLKEGVRLVDVVCLKGSSVPMRVYTDDRSNALHFSMESTRIFGADKVYGAFTEVFNKGMDGFVKGDWATAKTNFESGLRFLPHDKPCKRILWHMNTADNYPGYGLAKKPFEAPDDWQGYHFLLSK